MWEILRTRPRGRISRRNISLLATSVFVAVLACLGLSTPAYAEDVTRTSGTLTYQNKNFTTPVTIQPGDPRNLATSTTGAITAYEYTSPDGKKVEYLLFASGVDPATATTTLYTTFDHPSPTTYSNQSPSPPATLSIVSSTTPPMAKNESCQVPSVGWIICGVSNFIATGVDLIYGLTTQFLEVKPLAINNEGIYKVWDLVRNIANICFVIVFLIIIFSQVTSLGISKYGVLKALPRLVIAAILVNLSFWISALAIDISNFLGYSVYSLFKSVTQTMLSVPEGLTLTLVAQSILGGAAAAVGGTIWFAAATGGSIVAGAFILLSILISLAFSVLVAVVIMAARQGLIVVFTLISPLAFAAMVLPSTEKWFKKWQEAFVTMLLMFPIFAMLFGGSQIAGKAIIMGSSGSMLLVLLGLAVQIVPLALTPFIVRLSTGVLGTIASMVNNRSKGPVDRLRNWSSGQAEHHRKKSVANPDGRRGNIFRWTAQKFDNIDIAQKREQEGYEAASQRRAQSTARYRDADNYTRRMTQGKQLSDARLDRSWHRYMHSNRGRETLREYIDLRSTTDEATGEKAHVENIYNDLRKGKAKGTVAKTIYGKATAKEMAQRAYAAAEGINVTTIRKNQADQEVMKELNKQLLSDGAFTNALGVVEHRQIYGQQLQAYATGIGNAKRMLATEVEKARKIEGQEANAASELMKHFNVVDANDFVKLATKKNGKVTRTDSSGNTMTFQFDDEDVRAAAIAWVAKNGAYSQRKELAFSAADPSTNAALASYIQSELIANGFGAMAPWANDKTISVMGEGGIASMDDIMFHNFREIQEGRVKGEGLLSANNTALAEFFSTFKDREAGGAAWDKYLSQQEAMIRKEMDGKPAADANKAVADFRASIDDRYVAKYYDIMEQTKATLADPQLSARLNPQSKAEMNKAVADFYDSSLGRSQVAYRARVKQAQQDAEDGKATAAQKRLLDDFYKVYN